MNGIILVRNFAVMKRLFAVGILALVVMAWAACEEPAPTPGRPLRRRRRPL